MKKHVWLLLSGTGHLLLATQKKQNPKTFRYSLVTEVVPGAHRHHCSLPRPYPSADKSPSTLWSRG